LRIGGWGNSNTEVVFQDSGGRPPEVAIAIDYPTVQLLFRGLKYSETYKKAADIKAKLHALEQKSGGEPNDFYPELVACLVRGDITPLGQDDKNRFMFSL
ncbi:minor capsid protein, partial [Parvimonas micra]|uniref:phage tail terminator protein n=2 Tax=Parvimonas TaxID=543311 RepID=UPI002B496ED7